MESLLLSQWIYLSIATILLLLFLRRRRRLPARRLPSPPKLPIIGNLHQLSPLLHISLRDLALRHGPLMLLHFGSIPVLVASTAKAILKTHDHIFSSRRRSVAMDRLLHGPKGIAFSPYGEYWRQARRVTTLHLLSARRVQLMRAVREEEVEAMLEKVSSSSSSATAVNLSKVVLEMVNNVICRVALGRRCNSDGVSGIKNMMEELMLIMLTFDVGEYVPWLGFVSKLTGLHGRIKRNAMDFDRLLEKVVEDHVRRRSGAKNEEEEEESFVDVLLRVLEDEDVVIDRDGVKAILLDMFVAGTHTASATIEWAMAELIRSPPAMETAQEEVRRIGKGKLFIQEEDISNMGYLRMVIKEVLRLHPPVPLLLPRMSTGDVELSGCRVPAGTTVLVNVWAMGRDPNEWDRPTEFRPERFEGDGNERLALDVGGTGNFAFLPFGGGRRGCPGVQFGIMVVELALANLLFKFEWEVADGGSGAELDMAEAPGLAIKRKQDLNLVAIPWTL